MVSVEKKLLSTGLHTPGPNSNRLSSVLMVQDLFEVEVRLEDFRGEIENILYFSNLRRLLVQCSLFADGSVIFF